MAKDEITPFTNPRQPKGRKCPNIRCRHIIPHYITNPTFYKCPQCGCPGSISVNERGAR